MKPLLLAAGAILAVGLAAWALRAPRRPDPDPAIVPVATATAAAPPPAAAAPRVLRQLATAAMPAERRGVSDEVQRLGNRALPDAERIPADLGAGIPDPGEADGEALLAILRDPRQGDTARNEAANLLRRARHQGLEPALEERLGDPEEGERFRAFCVQHLGLSLAEAPGADREALAAVLRRHLDDRHLAVRREALGALAGAGDPAAASRLAAGPLDPAFAGMRDLALQLLGDQGHREAVLHLARSGGLAERMAALRVLVRRQDPAAAELAAAAAAAPEPRLRLAGEAALAALSGAGPRGASTPVPAAR